MLATIFATNTGLKILGGIAIFIGAAIRYWIGQRKFNRRNWAGVELFKSYSRMRRVTVLERLGRFVGILLIIAGILVVALAFITSNSTVK